MEDYKIIEQIQHKDEQAIHTLIEKYHKLLWCVVQNILRENGTPEDIEECISDVFMALWHKPHLFQEDKGALKNYLCSIARNLALNKLRQLKRHRTVAIDNCSISFQDEIENHFLRKEFNQHLYEIICRLKPLDKEIMIRRLFFNEKPKTIAKKMSLQSKDVENRIYYNKKKIKTILKEGVV